MNLKSRINYIDVAKGIGILLVVFQHCLGGGTLTDTMPATSKAIASFYMPLFFFISGYLYSLKPAKDVFYSKVKSLLIPLLLIYILNFFTNNIFSAFGLKNYLLLEGYWFIETLLFISIIYFLLDCWIIKVIKKHSEIILLCVSVIIGTLGLVYSYFFKPNFSIIINSAVAIMFYSFGYYYKIKIEKAKKEVYI